MIPALIARNRACRFHNDHQHSIVVFFVGRSFCRTRIATSVSCDYHHRLTRHHEHQRRWDSGSCRPPRPPPHRRGGDEFLREQWKSPLRPILSSTTNTTLRRKNAAHSAVADEGDGIDETNAVQVVPSDGWFAFCFRPGAVDDDDDTYIDHQHTDENNTTTSAAGATTTTRVGAIKEDEEVEVVENIPASRVLCTITPLSPPLEGTALPSTIFLELPLTNGINSSDDINFDFLDYDLNIGRLLYLTKNTTVHVESSCMQLAEAVRRDDNDDANNCDSRRSNNSIIQRNTLAKLRWRLVRYLIRKARSDTETVTTAPCGTLSRRELPFVCIECAKALPTAETVRNHWLRAHSDRHRRQQEHQQRQRQQQRDAKEDPDLWKRPLQVVFQDQHMAIINKPQGMATQGVKPCLSGSKRQLLPLANKDAPQDDDDDDDDVDDQNFISRRDSYRLPRPVHRLDRETGGILVLSKTRSAGRRLHEAFHSRDCHKLYRALVYGKLTLPDREEIGVVDHPLDGKPCRTHYQPIKHLEVDAARASSSEQQTHWYTVVDMWPVTGRIHQLRRHARNIKHSIVGDTKYQNLDLYLDYHDDRIDKSRMYLWAMEITLPHPHSGIVQTYRLPDSEPEWLNRVLEELEFC
jgi:23S rRNA-/tRNA-specific pseudouridylate synthase